MSLLGNVKMWFRKLMSWLKAFTAWLWEARTILGGIGVLVIALVLCISWPSETVLKSIGLGLQICGMVMALKLLLDLRTHFRQEPLLKLASNWFQRFPRWTRYNQIRNIRGVGPGATAHVVCGSKLTDDPSLPYRERLDKFFHYLEYFYKRLNTQEKQLDILDKEHNALKNFVETQNEEIQQKFQKETEELHTGSIVYSMVGLVWILVGVIVSTFPKELADHLK